jgi:predicted dehydrogenase
MQDFVASILHNRAPSISGVEALKPLQIILAIYQAARENREVQLSAL